MGTIIPWYIWKARNDYLFQMHPLNHQAALASILNDSMTPKFKYILLFQIHLPNPWVQ